MWLFFDLSLPLPGNAGAQTRPPLQAELPPAVSAACGAVPHAATRCRCPNGEFCSGLGRFPPGWTLNGL